MIKEYADYELLLDCFKEVWDFSMSPRDEMTPSERLSLNVMLDILKPNLADLH